MILLTCIIAAKQLSSCTFIKTACFLIVSMTCFFLTVTYIHITLGTRFPAVSVFKGPKYLIPLALKFRMPLVLLCSILNLVIFSWFKNTLVLLMLVCSFSLLSLFFLFSCLLLHYFFPPFFFFCTYTLSLFYFFLF